jgi:hypothetical protein
MASKNQEMYREALKSIKPYEVEGRFRCFDGEFRWFLFRGRPLRDPSGKVAKWYGTNTDLEERKRVGGNRTLTTDVRIIAAINRDLTTAIAAGTFRSYLFYRLSVFPIDVPPLRKRKEDIPMLVEYFVKRYAGETRQANLDNRREYA